MRELQKRMKSMFSDSYVFIKATYICCRCHSWTTANSWRTQLGTLTNYYFIIYIWRLQKVFVERRLLEGWPSMSYRNQWKSNMLFRGSRLAGLLDYYARLLPIVLVNRREIGTVERSKYFVCYSATLKYANVLWWRFGRDSFARQGTINGINLTIT